MRWHNGYIVSRKMRTQIKTRHKSPCVRCLMPRLVVLLFVATPPERECAPLIRHPPTRFRIFAHRFNRTFGHAFAINVICAARLRPKRDAKQALELACQSRVERFVRERPLWKTGLRHRLMGSSLLTVEPPPCRPASQAAEVAQTPTDAARAQSIPPS